MPKRAGQRLKIIIPIGGAVVAVNRNLIAIIIISAYRIIARVVYAIVIGVGNGIVIAVNIVLVVLVGAVSAAAGLIVGIRIVIAGIGTVVAVTGANWSRGRVNKDAALRGGATGVGYNYSLGARTGKRDAKALAGAGRRTAGAAPGIRGASAGCGKDRRLAKANLWRLRETA